MTTPEQQRTKVFISYSHSDADTLKRLQVHLKPLEQQGILDRWDDTRLQVGQRWKAEIVQAIASAKVAVLLVSADFLASDFITTDELPPLLGAAESEGLVILSVIVSPCRFENTRSISQFQAVNPPSQPLTGMSKHEQEALFVKVTNEIERVLNPPKSASAPPARQPSRAESAGAIGKTPPQPSIKPAYPAPPAGLMHSSVGAISAQEDDTEEALFDTQAIRAMVSNAVAHERQTGTLAALIAQYSMMQGGWTNQAGVAQTVDFVRQYVEQVPTLLDAVSAAADKAGIADEVMPILEAVRQYFLSPFDFIPDQAGLIGLADDAYLAHSLMYAIFAHHQESTGNLLVPAGLVAHLTQANGVIRGLIGEPLASQLDMAVANTLRLPGIQQSNRRLDAFSGTLPVSQADSEFEKAMAVLRGLSA